MDGFEEKKWFVYLGDHHEGPFSVTEIQAKMHEGQVTSSSYVWAEGMQDWLVMTEVAAFETLFKPTLVPTPQAFPEPEAFSTDDFALPEPMLEARPVGDGPSAEIRRGEQPGRAAETIELDRVQLTTSRPAAASQRMDDVEPSDVPEPKRRGGRGKGRYLFLLFVALVGGTIYYASHSDPNAQPPALRAGLQAIAGATQPLLGKLAEAAPFLARWISPIPALQDVSPEDYAELRKAAGASLEREGPRAAVALSTADPLTPTFYVATNLPDGAIVDVYVEGVPETLLNQLGFSSRVSVTITKKLGISPQVKFSGNQALPRGQYEIFAVEGEQQPQPIKDLLASAQPASLSKTPPASLPKGFKLIASRSYFLGGTQDATYAERLKEFHDKLREKAAKELSEIKQFEATLNATLNTTISDFGIISKVKGQAARRKRWEEHRKRWLGFSAQMTDIFQKWTPQVLETEFFYGSLYTMIQQVYRGVEQLHAVHHSYFTTTVDPKAFEIQAGQATATATAGMAALKAKIEQAEKIPPAPNGMPRREGL